MSSPAPVLPAGAPLRQIDYAQPNIACERGSDGIYHLRSRTPLEPYDTSLAAMFRSSVRRAPDRVFLAERVGDGWLTVTYAAARRLVDGLAQALHDRGLSAQRPVMILSGNAVDHALLMLAGHTAGVPVAPISVAYSLQSEDHAKLKHIAALRQYQAAVLVAHELDPQSVAYHLALPLRVRGPLNAARLRRAIEQLHRRHATLRTTYHEYAGHRIQRVHGSFEPIYAEVDASSANEDDLVNLAQREFLRPFDLTQAPSQVALYRRASEDHLLLWRFSHICEDLASADVILDELFALYAGDSLLPAPRATYLDFVTEQMRFRESAVAEAMGMAWEKVLSGVSSGLDLPFDHARFASRRGATGSSCTFRLDRELTYRLRTLSPNYFRMLLSAWFVLLFRLTRQEDLLCGVPASVRGPRFDGVVGHFANLLPVRVQASRRLPFREFAERVSAALRDASSRREYPYVDLLQRLHRGGDWSRPPLCEIDFGLLRMTRCPEATAHAIPGVPWKLPRAGLLLEAFPLAQGHGQYDLNGWVCEAGGETWGELKYVRELFDAETVGRIGDSFVELLRSIADRPDARLGELAVVPEEQRRVMLSLNARTRREVQAVTVPQMFEAQADRTPDAIALSAGGRVLTYREIEQRANRLAHLLIEIGVGPEATVGICLERSPEMVVALLAVHKRRLRALRRHLPNGSPRVHGRRCETTGAADADQPRLEATRRPVRDVVARARDARFRPRWATAPADRPGLRRLFDLHLGLDRATQGRRGAAAQCH
jgi:hypothetical protein